MKQYTGSALLLIMAAVVANLAFFAGLIWFAFWCARHFGLLH